MFVIWRQFVSWLRTLLVAWLTKKPIDWHQEIGEVLDIAKKVNDKTTPVIPNHTIPDYDLIGTTKFRLRDLFKKLRKKQ
jgi:hypothetical protein